MNFVELLDELIQLSTQGYVVLSIILFLASISTWKYHSLSRKMLRILGLLLSLGLILNSLTDIGWRIALHSDYNQYALSQLAFGETAWVWWVSTIVGLLAIALNLYKRYSTKLWVVVLSVVAVLYNQFEFWINKKIFNSSEFISSSWDPKDVKWYEWLYHYSTQSAFCLFIISIPMLWKFIRKR